MKKYFLLVVALGVANVMKSQYIYTIKADSVKITNNCDTAELILENHTQNVLGFLYNKGKGRTEFRRGLLKINDSLYLIGDDTLNTSYKANNGVSISGGNIVLGNDLGDTTSMLISNREIPMNNKFINLNGTGGSNTKLHGGAIRITHNSTNGIVGNGLSVDGTYDYVVTNAGTTLSTGLFTLGNTYTPHGTAGQIEHSAFGITDYFFPSGNANHNYTGIRIQPFYDFTQYSAGGATRTIRGIFYTPFSDGSFPNAHIAYENTTGNNIFNSGANGNSSNKGRAGFQGITSPTAYVHIGAGTATANTAPLKLTSGTLLTTAETGAVEFAGSRLTFTPGATRKRFLLTNDVAPTNGQIPVGNGTDYTVAALTPGTGIDIANASGSITISAKATIAITAAVTLNMTNTYTDYVFTGISTTWTLPSISGNQGIRFFIKNRGSGAITLNSNAGGNDLYTAAPVNTLTINPGEAYFLLNDGTYYLVK